MNRSLDEQLELISRGVEEIIPEQELRDKIENSIKDDNQVKVVMKTMEEAIPLLIKNKVSYKKGDSWGNAK